MQKGSLIVNTVILGAVIIFYYLSLMVMNYMFSIWDTIPILDTWRTAWDPTTKIFWDFIVWFFIPVSFIIAFIVHTKPQQEVIPLRRY